MSSHGSNLQGQQGVLESPMTLQSLGPWEQPSLIKKQNIMKVKINKKEQWVIQMLMAKFGLSRKQAESKLKQWSK